MNGVRISPSLLSADFARIGSQMRALEVAGADEFHLDSMDGQFVPNLTWGVKIVADLRRLTALPFDCHLMTREPERYFEAFRGAGADIITFHYEATTQHLRLLRRVRALGARAGIAINPGTPTLMLEDLIEEADRILVMSVDPGFGGQPFIERTLLKIAQVRALVQHRNAGCEIAVDGGIGTSNASKAVRAGARVLIAGSALFGNDADKAISRLRRTAEQAFSKTPRL